MPMKLNIKPEVLATLRAEREEAQASIKASIAEKALAVTKPVMTLTPLQRAITQYHYDLYTQPATYQYDIKTKMDWEKVLINMHRELEANPLTEVVPLNVVIEWVKKVEDEWRPILTPRGTLKGF